MAALSRTFFDLSLNKSLLAAVAAEGYSVATPIQAKAIPIIMAGRDLLGSAQTGTGKTAAFALPMLHRFAASPATNGRRRIRGLILAPTRELALQIVTSLKTYGRGLSLRHLVIYGGVGQGPQVTGLRNGIDILVATPGRLLDLMDQGHVEISGVEILVLDEADRMLDMGFIPDIRRIAAKLPTDRQTLLFSATMPPTIQSLARALLRNPERVEVAPPATTAERIEQCVYHVEKANKPALLAHLVETQRIGRAIVFTRTKHGADRVVRQLSRYGIAAAAIHGNKSQNNRQRVLESFRSGQIRLMVATDVAARGIDVDGITHIFNYDLSHEPETYVHRIGRTARAGASGTAISFCDREERDYLQAIERMLRTRIEVRKDQPAFRGQLPGFAHHAPVNGASRPIHPPTKPAAIPPKRSASHKSSDSHRSAPTAYGQPKRVPVPRQSQESTVRGGHARTGKVQSARFGFGASKPRSKAAKRRSRRARMRVR